MKTYLFLATIAAVAAASAQGPDPDPFTKAGARMQPAQEADVGPVNLSTCFETFSIPLDLAARLHRELLGDAALYNRLVSETGNDGIRQESFVVIRSRSGQRAKAESVSEQIYPVEWLSPGNPNSVGVAVSSPTQGEEKATRTDPELLREAPDPFGISGLQTPVTPKTLETRNVGSTFEIEAVADTKMTVVDLRMHPEIVTFGGRASWGQEGGRIDTPTFESQRIDSAATGRMWDGIVVSHSHDRVTLAYASALALAVSGAVLWLWADFTSGVSARKFSLV